jgi:hypothetical protein
MNRIGALWTLGYYAHIMLFIYSIICHVSHLIGKHLPLLTGETTDISIILYFSSQKKYIIHVLNHRVVLLIWRIYWWCFIVHSLYIKYFYRCSWSIYQERTFDRWGVMYTRFIYSVKIWSLWLSLSVTDLAWIQPYGMNWPHLSYSTYWKWYIITMHINKAIYDCCKDLNKDLQKIISFRWNKDGT